MDTDLADRLDRSIGPAPDGPDPLADVLAAGHRTVRRRRAAVSIGAAALVAGVLGATATLAGGSGDRAQAPVVSQPSAAASSSIAPSSAAAPEEPSRRLVQGVMRAVTVTEGDVRTTRGAVVVRSIDIPSVSSAERTAVAFEVDFRGYTWWFVDVSTPDGNGRGTAAWAGGAGPSFEDWADREAQQLADQEANEPSNDPDADAWPGVPSDDLVAFVDGGEELAPVGETVVVEQRAAVDVGESFAGPSDRTAAALVRTADGTELYVLARAIVGEVPQYIAVPRAEGGADLDAFLDLARERYAEGGGGLL